MLQELLRRYKGTKMREYRTNFIKAIHDNKIDVIQHCITKNAIDINMQDKDGWTALMYTAYTNNIEVTKYLIEYGADVNIQNIDGSTALIHAACEGYLETIMCLVEHGAQIDIQKKNGYTALIHAACKNHLCLMKCLIKYGADINMQTRFGYDVLTIAAIHRNLNVVQYLIEIQGHSFETYLAHPNSRVRQCVKAIREKAG